MGMLSAIIPDKPVIGLNKCEIITINKLFSNDQGDILLNYSKLKHNEHHQTNFQNTESVKQSLVQGYESSISSMNIRYMNDITHQLSMDAAIEMNINGPDIWIQPFMNISNAISINTELKTNFVIHGRKKRKGCGGGYKRWHHSKFPTKIYIAIPDNNLASAIETSNLKYHLILYDIGDKVATFAAITFHQYQFLKSLSDGNILGIHKNIYKDFLLQYAKSNKIELITVLLLNHTSQVYETVICRCSHQDSLPKHIRNSNALVDNMYTLNTSSSPNDFQLPDNTVSVFRSYLWPYKYKLNETILHMLNTAFKGKGLIRSCCPHQGNFEMFGKRCS